MNDSTTQLSLFGDDTFKSPFDQIKHTDDNGVEYWLARELMTPLGYLKWQKFLAIVKKAIANCKKSGNDADYHFTRLGKMIGLGKGGQRELEDYRLTRHACYLIALNGDSSKQEIADAKTYFAQQTELFEQAKEKEKQRQIDNHNRAVVAYQITGNTGEWSEARVTNKEALREFNGAAIKFHEAKKPDFARLHGVLNREVFDGMVTKEVCEYLGLMPKDYSSYRDHLGTFALQAFSFAYALAQTLFGKKRRLLTTDEQGEIARQAAKMIVPTMKQVADSIGEDFISGAPLDENGNALITRNIPLLPKGK